LGVRHERPDVADPKEFQREWQLQLLLHPLDPSHPFKKPSVFELGAETTNALAVPTSRLAAVQGVRLVERGPNPGAYFKEPDPLNASRSLTP